METPTNAAEAPTSNEEDEDEERSEEDGSGRDKGPKVPEYKKQRQEHIRKNALKLHELGVPILAASLKESTLTCTTKSGGER